MKHYDFLVDDFGWVSRSPKGEIRSEIEPFSETNCRPTPEVKDGGAWPESWEIVYVVPITRREILQEVDDERFRSGCHARRFVLRLRHGPIRNPSA